MRILYLDLDTLRPDHLGCYGYHRETSPNIDWIASQGVRFENCYVSDAPCLPSRASAFTGRFGIHTGVVGHGGTAADLRIEGASRRFTNNPDRWPWMMALRQAGIYTASISPYAERHGAWWFYHGFREMFNPGKRGMERADEVAPYALRWIEQNGKRDNWFLQLNFWDPHTPYRTPITFGNPFADDPIPDWITDEIIEAHYHSYGPHSAHDPAGYGPFDPKRWAQSLRVPEEVLARFETLPSEIRNREDFRKWIDGYDIGIRYMDDYIGKVLEALDAQGVLDETVIIVSSDHGENQGELNVYGDHQTADHITSRVPLIVRWPGLTEQRVDHALHYQTDWAATVLELVGAPIPPLWDGVSFASAFRRGEEAGRDCLVVSQCAWSCQRSVRVGPWLMIRTYHDGLKDFPPIMLFNVEEDPHETTNLADQRPDVVNECLRLLDEWHAQMMNTSLDDTDPMWTVIREGGPFHTRGHLESYAQRLRETGREHHAEALLARHGSEG
ncbi:MAG: sulfatase-like hydrolase/transferase [Chloroflexi bacterium]|nr:sulfatase-like hydrolase/transferase [Chloroflexota bacterium]